MLSVLLRALGPFQNTNCAPNFTYRNVGVALERTGAYEAAEREYARAITLDPGYSAAHNNLGTLLSRRGDTDAAHAAFVRAVTANADNAEARANLAVTSIARGDYDGGAKHALAAMRLRPDRAFACRLAEVLTAATPPQGIAALKGVAAACK